MTRASADEGAGGASRASRNDLLPGTLSLMILKALDALGPLNGYGIARRLEQTSGQQLILNHGSVYPALVRLEQLGWIASKWTVSENKRRARAYSITRSGRRRLDAETAQWTRTAGIVARVLRLEGGKP